MISLNKTSKMPNLKKGNLIKFANGASFRYSHYRNFIPDKYKNFDYQIVILLDFEKYQDKNVLKIRRLLSHPHNLTRIAALGLKAIQEWDQTSKSNFSSIINQSHHELIQLVSIVLKRLDWNGPAPLSLMGGAFENDAFRKQFILTLKQEKLGIYVINTSF